MSLPYLSPRRWSTFLLKSHLCRPCSSSLLSSNYRRSLSSEKLWGRSSNYSTCFGDEIPGLSKCRAWSINDSVAAVLSTGDKSRTRLLSIRMLEMLRCLRVLMLFLIIVSTYITNSFTCSYVHRKLPERLTD